MEVAVAGVPERPDPDVVPRGDRLDRAEHVRDPRAGHADVLHLHVADLLERPVRGPPGLPQQVGLGRVCERTVVVAPTPDADRLGAGELVVGRDAPAGPTRSSASPPRRGRGPAPCTSSTARIVNWSISSSVTGDSPAAAIPATASPAASSVGKKASSVARGGGAGRSRRVASVIERERALRPDERWVSE